MPFAFATAVMSFKASAPSPLPRSATCPAPIRAPGAYFATPYGSSLRVRPWIPADRHEAAHVIGASLAEYGLGWEPKGADADVVQVEAVYAGDRAEFWVVEDTAGEKPLVVGTAALKRHGGDTVVEIRKMYLDKAARGVAASCSPSARSARGSSAMSRHTWRPRPCFLTHVRSMRGQDTF
jgi:hypothetical protein